MQVQNLQVDQSDARSFESSQSNYSSTTSTNADAADLNGGFAVGLPLKSQKARKPDSTKTTRSVFDYGRVDTDDEKRRVLRNAKIFADKRRQEARASFIAQKRALPLLSGGLSRAQTQTEAEASGMADDGEEVATPQVDVKVHDSWASLRSHIQSVQAEISQSVDLEKTYKGLFTLRYILAQGAESGDNTTLISQVFDSGVIRQLFQIMDSTGHEEPCPGHWPFKLLIQAKQEIAWILINMSLGTARQVSNLHKRGAVDTLVAQLTSPDVKLVTLSVWALANFAADDFKIRDEILDSGLMARLSVIYEKMVGEKELQKEIIFFMSNCVRNSPLPRLSQITDCARTLASVLKNSGSVMNESESEEALLMVLHSFDVITQHNVTVLDQLARQYDLYAPLVHLTTNSSNQEICLVAFKIMSMICSSDTGPHVGKLLDSGLIESIKLHLTRPLAESLCLETHKRLKSEVCLTLSNLAADEEPRIVCEILKHRLFEEAVVPLYFSCQESPQLKLELTFCVTNILTRATYTQAKTLVTQAMFLHVLVDSLKEDDSLGWLAQVGLNGIAKLFSLQKKYSNKKKQLGLHDSEEVFIWFEEIGGLDMLEKCQQHASTQVYQKAQKLLLKYYKMDTSCFGPFEEFLAPTRVVQ